LARQARRNSAATDLTWRQKLVAGIVATATVIAAIGAAAQGWAAYNDWGLQGRLEIGGVSATVTNKPIRRPC
jgi:hypothetical protein